SPTNQLQETFAHRSPSLVERPSLQTTRLFVSVKSGETGPRAPSPPSDNTPPAFAAQNSHASHCTCRRQTPAPSQAIPPTSPKGRPWPQGESPSLESPRTSPQRRRLSQQDRSSISLLK